MFIYSTVVSGLTTLSAKPKLPVDCGIFRRPIGKIPQFDPFPSLKPAFYRGTLIAQKYSRGGDNA
jgi:hypothetical protein